MLRMFLRAISYEQLMTFVTNNREHTLSVLLKKYEKNFIIGNINRHNMSTVFFKLKKADDLYKL